MEMKGEGQEGGLLGCVCFSYSAALHATGALCLQFFSPVFLPSTALNDSLIFNDPLVPEAKL